MLFRRVLLFLVLFLSTCYCKTSIRLNDPTDIFETNSTHPSVDFVYEDMPSLGDNKIFFIITPIAGDPDVYIQVNGNWYNSTQPSGVEIIELSSEDQGVVEGCSFDIRVEGYDGRDCAFTVMVYIQDSEYLISLLEGVPQIGQVKRSHWVYFTFKSSIIGEISVGASDIVGDTDLCITKDGKRPTTFDSHCFEKDIQAGSDIITFNKTEEGEVTYIIGVYGFLSTSTFNIFFSHENVHIVIPESFPVQGLLHHKEEQYYKYYLCNNESEGLTFTAVRRSSTGDADIYVSRSFSDGGKYPSFDHHTWFSAKWGGDEDYLEIRKDGEHGEYFTEGWYYISIRAFQGPVRYDFYVAREDYHVVLQNGRSFRTMIKKGDYQYYMYQFSQHSEEETGLDIYVEPSVGTIHLYGSRDDIYPDESNTEYEEENVGTVSVMHIEGVEEGWYYFGVKAEEDDRYVITSSITNLHTFIIVGQTTVSQVLYHDFKYFLCDIGTPVDNDIQVAVTTTNMGNADLYISAGSSDPTLGEHDWKSVSQFDTDVITIKKDDPALENFDGTLRIGVYGNSSEEITTYSYFTIIVTESNSIIELKGGVPTPGSVEYHEEKIYEYYMNSEGRLTIGLQVYASVGVTDADIYVAKGFIPTRTNYTWKSIKPGSRFDYVSFETTIGWHYILVRGFSYTTTTYAISANEKNTHLSNDGTQMVDTVFKGDWRYYTVDIIVSDIEFFFVGLTLISGSTTMYLMNSTDKPDEYNYHSKDDVNWPYNHVENYIDGQPLSTYKKWTIGIYGEDTSTYYIHASAPIDYWDFYHFQAHINNNNPLVCKAFEKDSKPAQYFMFSDSAIDSDYRIYIRLFNNSATRLKIYIDQVSTRPNKFHNTWEFDITEGSTVLTLEKKNIRVGNNFFFGVYSELSDAIFQITMSPVTEPIYLTQENSLDFETVSGEEMVFEVFSALYSSGLNVIMDSCSDRVPPKFIVSTTSYGTANSTTDHYYSQVVSRDDFLYDYDAFVIKTVPIAFNQKFSVYAYTREDFRPTVGGVFTITLQEGINYRIDIPRASSTHSYNYFLYHIYTRVLEGEEEEGSINVYTPCAVTQGTSRFKHVNTIRDNKATGVVTDFFDLEIGDYAVMVIVESPHGHQRAYEPVFVTSGEGEYLVNGVSRMSTLSKGEKDDYKIEEIDETKGNGKHLIVSVTPFDGDVSIEMYSKKKKSKKYVGDSFGFDILDVTLSPDTTFGEWIITVTAETDSSYSILYYVQLDNESYVQLPSTDVAVPQLMKAPAGKTVYFKLELDEITDFSIDVTPISGDPDVYASTTKTHPSRGECSYMGSDCWFSISYTMDAINIKTTDDKYVEYGTYYAGAYAFGNVDTIFSMIAVKDQSIERLTAGLPFGRTAQAGETVYFVFELTQDSDLEIIVTPVTLYGDPDIYVSRLTKRPAKGHCEWSSEQPGADQIILKNAKADKYYIGVKGYEVETDFQIIVMGAMNSSILVDGVVQEIYKHESYTWKYFRTYHGYEENSLHVSVQPTTGIVKMYASRITTKPDENNYEYESEITEGIVFLDIPETEPLGYYYIGVYNNGALDSSYTIQVQTSSRTTLLLNGQLSRGYVVVKSFYKYFEFDIPVELEGLGAVIAMQVLRGDPDIYVSCTNPRPTKKEGEHTWESREFGRDSIDITGEELMENSCERLYIGIYGFRSSQFRLVAFLGNTTIQLFEDNPHPGYIREAYNQYYFENDKCSNIFINLKMKSERPADGDLYVDVKPHPTQATHEWASTRALYDDYVYIENPTEGQTYYIAVYAFIGPFDYVISVSCEYTQVIDGEQVIQFSDKGNSRCFQTTLGYNTRRMIASVTPINGETILYANDNSTLPKEYGKYTTTVVPNVLDIDHNSYVGEQFPLSWSFCVIAETDSDYYFGVSGDMSGTLLSPGVPVISASSNSDYTYFKFTKISEDEDSQYFILLNGYKTSKFEGCFEIFADQDIVHPSGSNAKWHQKTEGVHDFIILELEDIDHTREFSNLYVSVKSCSESDDLHYFSIMANSNQLPSYLLHDRYFTFTDEYTSEYAFKTSEHSKQLLVQFDVCYSHKITDTSFLTLKVGGETQDLPMTIGDNDYSVKIFTESDFIKEEDYYIYVETPEGQTLGKYTIYISTEKPDPRPVIPEEIEITSKLIEQNEFSNIYSIVTEEAEKAEKTDVLEYHLYYYKFDTEQKEFPTNFNYWTLCSVLMSDSVYSGVMDVGNTSIVSSKLNLTKDHDYMVNIIVQNQDYVRSVYQPIFIKRTTDPVNPPGGVKWYIIVINITVASLLIIIALFVISILIIILFKYVAMNKRGLEVIPFIGFFRRCFRGFRTGKKGKKFIKMKEDEMDDEMIMDDDTEALEPGDSGLFEESTQKHGDELIGKYGSL